ncbi:MAG: acyl-CoA thioesterase, partial [Planctomycetes bacterium]|nr:acyl-CoA thioesterase [Planctomycetota bacterium]
MLFRFAAEVPLRWVDVDSAGVVNNAVYLNLMEQARYLYFT